MQGKKLTQRGSKRVWLAQLVLDYGWETFRPELDVNILIRLTSNLYSDCIKSAFSKITIAYRVHDYL